jgi:hypothetical protein
MGRAAKKLNIITAVTVVVAIGLGGWAHVANSPSHRLTVVTNAQHQAVQLSYQGQVGQNALALLKKHATVQTKHYSYINGKMAQVGAGSYVTKAADTLMWKLQ